MSDKSQRTEEPTPRRLEKARAEGRFPVSRDFVSALAFMTFALLLTSYGAETYRRLIETSRELFVYAFRAEITPQETLRVWGMLARRDLAPLLTLGGILMAVTLGSQLLTTRMGVSGKRLAPDLNRLNPMKKLMDLPKQNVPQLLQAVLVLPVLGFILYNLTMELLPSLVRMPLLNAAAGASVMAESIRALVMKGAFVFLVWGAVDFYRQQRRHTSELKMSKQEIRDEAKETEGNPQIKSRVRRLQRDLLRRRMMQQVPTATAVVVNPTHYAVAVKYEMNSTAAPVVVAKGKNYLALRIRQKAVEHQVPIVENPPLAQALYKSTQVGQEIPANLYQAVAEILAYIFKLMYGKAQR